MKDGNWKTVFEYRAGKAVYKGTTKKDKDGGVSVDFSCTCGGQYCYGSHTTVENDLRAELFFYDKLYGAVLGGTWLIMQTVQRQVTEPHEKRIKGIRSQYTRLEVDKFREIMGTLSNLDIDEAKKKLNTICGNWHNEPPTNFG